MDHPLIGKRIEHVKGTDPGGVVVLVFVDLDAEPRVIIAKDDGCLYTAWFGGTGWRIVTPKPTATASPEPDADGWIPIDGTRPTAPGRADIVIRCRDGLQIPGTVDSFDYRHNGNNDDAVAWRRA